MNHVDRFFARLNDRPAKAVALTERGSLIDFRALRDRVARSAEQLRQKRVRVAITRLDNGIDAVVHDLACLHAQVAHVPLPPFFTEAQAEHAIAASRADLVIDAAGRWQRRTSKAALPADVAKVTFTSGTTGTPKGVCLSADAMLGVAAGIVERMQSFTIERHFCALPLAVLLENIAGIYAPLMRGATIVVGPLADSGLRGASNFNPGILDTMVRAAEAHSIVLLPQMLRAWTAWLETSRCSPPASLAFVAVGGAAVGTATLQRARAVGLPAFEGYGLSEGASVQTLNVPGNDRAGSVGRPLPHARLRIAADGEVEVGGALMLGYLGRAGFERRTGDWLPTGDLGCIDADGFVHIVGRRKDCLITAYGRNVSPEWVEAELHGAGTAIARAAVLGDGEPALGAVIWPSTPTVADRDIAAAVDAANVRLPDYARVTRWVRAWHAFDPATGVATANGRPRRDVIAVAYAASLFKSQET